MRVPSGRWSRLVASLVLVTAVATFSWLHARLGQDEAVAQRNAHRLVGLENRLGFGIEPAVNGWLARHGALMVGSVGVYRLYYLAILAVVVWLGARHRREFVVAALTWIGLATLALFVFWQFPVAPPRLALPGVVDVVAAHDLGGAHASVTGSGNHNSALPSMHTGWALWCAYSVWLVRRTWWPRIFPAVMVGVVIGTGNHYVFDVLLAGALLMLSHWVSSLVTRRWLRAQTVLDDHPTGP